jgi:hypothetical protein
MVLCFLLSVFFAFFAFLPIFKKNTIFSEAFLEAMKITSVYLGTFLKSDSCFD